MRAIDNTHSSFPNFRYNVIMAEHLTDHSQLLWETYARLGVEAPSTARESLCPSRSPPLLQPNQITKQPTGGRRYEGPRAAPVSQCSFSHFQLPTSMP